MESCHKVLLLFESNALVWDMELVTLTTKLWVQFQYFALVFDRILLRFFGTNGSHQAKVGSYIMMFPFSYSATLDRYDSLMSISCSHVIVTLAHSEIKSQPFAVLQWSGLQWCHNINPSSLDTTYPFFLWSSMCSNSRSYLTSRSHYWIMVSATWFDSISWPYPLENANAHTLVSSKGLELRLLILFPLTSFFYERLFLVDTLPPSGVK